MRKFRLIVLLSLLSVSLFAQKKMLDFSVYDGWKSISSFLISDNANVSFTEYKNFIDKSILEIKIQNSGFVKIIKGASSPQFFYKQRLAFFTKKDTLFLMDIAKESIKSIALASKPNTHDDSKYISYFKDNTHYILDAESFIKGQENIDSAFNIKKSSFLNSANIMMLCSDSSGASFVSLNLDRKDSFVRDTVFCSHKFIHDFDFRDNGKSIVFFSSVDSSGLQGVEVEVLEKKSRDRRGQNGLYVHNVTQLNESMLPENRRFNLKKGISFSEDGSYLKFEITPVTKKLSDSKKSIAKKPAFEYELWRWNDTLLPSQKRRSSIYANNLRCLFRLNDNRFIQLSHGKGIFLMTNDSSPYGFELDNRPYLYEDIWKDPIPKDFYCTNVKTGEYKMLFKGFEGVFAISPTTPYLFTYEYNTEAWYVNNLDNGLRINLSELVPYSLTREDFDEPQPAGVYGQDGLTVCQKFFIVYDKYDIWAVPIDGNAKEVYCVTNGYGRKNNIKFKILNISKGPGSSDVVDLKSDIILGSVNLDNMHSGYYRALKGKDPVKLLEGPYKFSYPKLLKNGNYILKRESFSEAPDYWLANENFKLIRRVTSLNEQFNDYKTGHSKVIDWKDSSGVRQTGVLYTPENYDSTKAYPTIVYFYETMSQDAFLFYEPAPTTSTINPIMFVSRGYVIFMPDIKYEIGWPGKSCLNIVESGTRYLIEKGIADGQKLGVQGHSWGGYQVAYVITQTNLFTCACSEAAVANMTSAYTGLRTGPGKPRMFMYESSQSRIGGTLWEKKQNYIENSPLFYLDHVTTPLLSRHSDGDEAVPYSQGLELFLGLKRLGKEVWMFNYKGDGHNIKKREIALDWTKRMDEYFDYYLLGAPKPKWIK